jgi:hypothetical protein
MVALLGILLQANSDAAVAVYLTLRRASARIEAINAAASIVLTTSEKELLAAVLMIHQSAEAERNALAHGCFISMDTFPDGIIWVESSKYSQFLVEYHRDNDKSQCFGFLKVMIIWSEKTFSSAFYYRTKDLEAIFAQIDLVMKLIRDFGGYLLWAPNQLPSKPERFDQLCNAAPIQDALRAARAFSTISKTAETIPSSVRGKALSATRLSRGIMVPFRLALSSI